MSMIVNPFVFAASGGGPTGDVTIAVQEFDTGTTTGAQDFTSSALTGVTPKAVLSLAAFHDPTNDPNETPGMSANIAMVGSSPRRIAADSKDNNATTLSSSGWADPAFEFLRNTAGTNVKISTSASLISGGLRATYTTNTAPSLRHFYVAFAGADLSAASGLRGLGSTTSPEVVNTVGFTSDAVLVMDSGKDSPSYTGPLGLGFGIGVNDGSATQRCLTMAEPTSVADGSPVAQLRNDCIAMSLNTTTGASTVRTTIGAYGASGFSFTSTASAAGKDVQYIALNFGGRQFKLVDFTTPTATGNATITGAGFTPSFALVVLSNLETFNDETPGASTDNMGGFAISAITTAEQWAVSWRIDSGAATTDTASQVKNAAIMGASATDCDAILASFVEWTSDGVTVNYSAVQGTAKRGFILFVE